MRRLRRLLPGGLCAGLLLTSLGAQPTAGPDRAEHRLTQLLRPAPTPVAGEPVAWPGARAVEQPAAPLPAYCELPPRVRPAPTRPVRPGPLAEDALTAVAQGKPSTPKAPLPTQPLARIESEDVRKPLPLPIFARPQKDRAAAADPTLDSSFAAALKPVEASRTQPEPFVAQNLPEPYEHVKEGRLSNPPDELPAPPAITIRPPAK